MPTNPIQMTTPFSANKGPGVNESSKFDLGGAYCHRFGGGSPLTRPESLATKRMVGFPGPLHAPMHDHVARRGEDEGHEHASERTHERDQIAKVGHADGEARGKPEKALHGYERGSEGERVSARVSECQRG